MLSSGHDELASEACVEKHIHNGKLNLTAIICRNDYMGIGAMRALKRQALESPLMCQ